MKESDFPSLMLPSSLPTLSKLEGFPHVEAPRVPSETFASLIFEKGNI